MKYGKIDATAHTLTIIEAATADDAKHICGLKPMEIDIGTVHHEYGVGGCAIMVAEFGLFVPPINQHFFAIGNRVYAGNALLYAYNAEGYTIDFDDPNLEITWFADGREVEDAILAGKIIRPTVTRDGVPVWEWPDPKPEALFPS